MVFFDLSGKRRKNFLIGLFIFIALVWGIIGSIANLISSSTYASAPAHAAIDWSNPAFEKTLALTFDDGPHPLYTPKLVELLEKEGVPATFFLVGENVIRHPIITRSLVEKGFEVGNHSFTHAESVHDSPKRVQAEIVATDHAIAAVTGRASVLYRPPFLLDIGFGEVNGRLVDNEMLRTVEGLGMLPVGSDLDPTDWETASSDDYDVIYEKLVAGVEKGGRVILMHDHGGGGATIDALEDFIPQMKAEGYTFVPVSYYFGLTPEEVMPPLPSPIFTTQYFLTIFLILAVLGGVLLHLLSALVAGITLSRMWTILATRRLVVPRMPPRGSLAFEKNIPSTLMNSTPVSVLIPAYNEAANIEATIRSVLSGSRIPEQVIVINDGSVDGTQNVVEKLIGEYGSRLMLLSKRNGGSKANALSFGLTHAIHPIIISIDADTIVGPYTIEHLIAHFTNPRVGAVAGKIYPATTKTIVEKFQYLEYIQGQNLDKEVFSLGSAVGIVPGAIGAWRKSALFEVGGYSDETVVEDQDLTLALLSRGWLVRFEARAVAYTETPSTVYAFFRQRFRWMYGTLQCFFKYQQWFFSRKQPWLGFIVLPNMVIFNIAFPLATPFIDAAIIAALFGLVDAPITISALLLYLALDLWFAGESLIHEAHPRYKYLWYVAPQRWFYRYIIAFTVIKSVIVALSGSLVKWGRHHRRGAAKTAWASVWPNELPLLPPITASHPSSPSALASEPQPAPAPVPII